MAGKTEHSFNDSAYDRARLALLKHAATRTLVENGEYPLERWAKEFAEHRARYDQVVSILHPDKDPRKIDTRTQNALMECDGFIRLHASSNWEGRWVDPQWLKAALEREKNERELRAAQILEAAEVKFDYPQGEMARSRKTLVIPEMKQKSVKRRVLAAVEIEIPRKHSMPPQPSSFSKKRERKTSDGAPLPVKRTRSQTSLKQHSLTSLGIRDSPPLTVKNTPQCDRCINKKKECFSEMTRKRCEACCRGKLACSLVRTERNLTKVASSSALKSEFDNDVQEGSCSEMDSDSVEA
ncbi:hypothetical protein BT96DRAFT_1022440 [Gymnopus androsaceus JB14]|uniref:Uncharacterized protein n=1 Tax=Gymnopus androsaceus JB14 TaxID=1447944 RepID=A0A6A4H8Y7_9AGAR|nr:hypothetical protein BT96DRAFT_1022440 [Gymnopus androsaceus JB14]